MALQLQSFFLPYFLLIAVASGVSSDASKITSCSSNFFDDHPELHPGEAAKGIFVTLHDAQGPCSPLKNKQPSSAAEILRQDAFRVEHLTSRVLSTKKTSTTTKNKSHLISDLRIHPSSSNNRQSSSSMVSIPLSSGLSLGVGNYVTKIGLGSPSKEYVVVVDTGSSLTWIQCHPCLISCYDQVGPIFKPNASSSYGAVRCSTPECASLQAATLNPSACSKSNVCIYEASYGDSSYSMGYLGKDALSFGKSKMLSNFVFGCGQDNEGLFGKAAGLAGLAKDKLSMLGQLGPTYGNAFSYCLPASLSSSGYLSIGSISAAKYTFTPMISNPMESSLYYISLAAITVDGKPIPIPGSTYQRSKTIIDSGTVITRLLTPVYDALSDAVVKSMSGKPRAPAFSILETCFKGSYADLPVPRVSLVFAGGAEMKLSPGNVFYDLKSNGITCLAFAKSNSITIIGNRQQLTFSVAYDVANSRIGFAACGCS